MADHRIFPVSRRRLLQQAGGLAGAALLPDLAARAAAVAGRLIKLRLMATSDLHSFIYDYDYYRGQTDPTVGFAKTARLIAEARRQTRNSLLFDNGDLIQGNPLSDYVAAPGGLAVDAVHPVFRAMNGVGYDAATLGNHEFNYGLDFLGRALAGAGFPYVGANLQWVDGRAYAPPTALLKRELVAEDGSRHRVAIGVIGFLPPQVMVWDRSNLQGRVQSFDIVESAARHVPALRQQADLVIALCHSGIAPGSHAGGEENAAYHLASVPGLDVIFTGHSHRVFPGPDYADLPGIDAARGTLAGVPAVMPGFWGSHLGVIDLALSPRRGGGWAVAEFAVEARPIYRRQAGQVVPLVEDEPEVLAAAAPEHRATIVSVDRPVGRSRRRITSYLAMLRSEESLGLIHRAQLWYAAPLLAKTPHAGLPLLSAAAPFKAGHTPQAFIDIPAGELSLRNIADLYIYPNTVQAVRVSGAQLREWLERAANVFNTLDPARGEAQPLINSRVPTYNFDVVSGVTYAIDLTQPPRYAGSGKVAAGAANRIVDLRYQGQPVADGDAFVVVTNNYRAGGGGNFPGLDGSNIVLEAPDTNREAIIRFVGSQGVVDPQPLPGWRFLPPPRPVTVSFASSPAARDLLTAEPGIVFAEETADGYAQFRMTLG